MRKQGERDGWACSAGIDTAILHPEGHPNKSARWLTVTSSCSLAFTVHSTPLSIQTTKRALLIALGTSKLYQRQLTFSHMSALDHFSLTLNKEHAMIKDFQNMPKGVKVISWR